MVAAADAEHAVPDMVSADAARRLAPQHPNTAAWSAAAVDPTPEERRRTACGFVGDLAAPGYGELLDVVASVGDEAAVRERITASAGAGITEVCIVPPPLGSPSGRRTLETLDPSGT